ncbi:TonB-dependent receptor [Marinimicrobium agarilyticum]|uniref:TonB-dependent receptor n=1 Tax=Marinimicrobium agarilyticum TaxID=306546 RepID=UPI0004170EE6|nr:TonB-dependent receptor [Marinimicrobium agarilyticum]
MYSKTALSSAILAAILAQSVSAQETEEPLLEEIVVTGIRSSLNKALDIKRDSTQIVDAIVAEDIGKFPDNNVIESLQRVTGVQTTGRGAGEVSAVSIRGLSDVHTTVNGRDVFTGAGRAVALQDIPASLLAGVTVYKTRSAEQVERGIAGSIDVLTHRPFNFDGSKVVVAGRAIYADQAKEVDPNISALFSNRWDLGAAGEFGALLNVSYAETNYRDDTMTAGAVFPFFTADPHYQYAPYERIPNNHSDGSPIWQAGLEQGIPYAEGSTLNVGGTDVEYLMMRDAIFGTAFTGKRERPAASVSLQWAPNDELEFVGEMFYTGYRNSSQNAMWFSNTFENQNGNIEIPTIYDGTNVVKEHQGKRNGGFQSGDYSYGETDSFLYALGATWEPTDSLTINSELIYQDSEFTTDFFAMRFDRVSYGLDVDYNDNDGVPSLTLWDNPETTDVDESDMAAVANWNAGTIYDNGGGNSGDASTFTVDADWQLDNRFINAVKVGGRYEVRTAEEFTRAQDAGGSQPLQALMDELAEAGAGDGSGLVFTVNDYFDGRADIFDSYITADGSYMLDNASAVRSAYGLEAEAVYKTFDIEETSAAAYVTADFTLGDRVSGELGARYVSYEQDMQFWAETAAQTNEYEFSEDTAEVSDVLPSVVVNWDITNDVVARLAYTQTLRMPNFADLNALQYWQDPLTEGAVYGTGTGGNPDLEPTESTNYDLSLEWYFAEGSSLYGAVFKREIEGLVIPGRTTIVRTGNDGVERPYVLSAPVNAADGELSGVELGLVYFPDNLPEVLDGLGVQASYTALDSSQQTPEFAEDGSVSGYVDSEMSGVSDSSYSVVLAYDKEVFDARLSYVWREAFYTGNEAAIFANPIQFWNRPEQSLDFQFSYDVTDSLVVSFDATNLLDDVYQSYYGEGNQNLFNFSNGIYSRTFALGARYSF